VTASPADPDLLRSLRSHPVADLCDAAARLGIEPAIIDQSIAPRAVPHFAGRAVTLARAAPDPDVFEPQKVSEPQSVLHELIQACDAGSVLVVSHAGDTSRAFWGANMTARALAHDIVGLVTYGAVRDLENLRTQNFAVFAQGVTPRGGGNRFYRPRIINGPVLCGGVLIEPGDLLIGDSDGILVLRPDDANSILKSLGNTSG
jgi:regulator of RNase E activity RraA